MIILLLTFFSFVLWMLHNLMPVVHPAVWCYLFNASAYVRIISLFSELVLLFTLYICNSMWLYSHLSSSIVISMVFLICLHRNYLSTSILAHNWKVIFLFMNLPSCLCINVNIQMLALYFPSIPLSGPLFNRKCCVTLCHSCRASTVDSDNLLRLTGSCNEKCILHTFMDPRGSLLCLQEPTTRPHAR